MGHYGSIPNSLDIESIVTRMSLSVSKLLSWPFSPWNHTAVHSLTSFRLNPFKLQSLCIAVLLLRTLLLLNTDDINCQSSSFQLKYHFSIGFSWSSIFSPIRLACLLSFHWHFILCSHRLICWVVYCVSISLKTVSWMDQKPYLFWSTLCSQHLDQCLTHNTVGAQWIYAA